MNKMNSKKGFTLIEMLVVIAIIAILVAIIVPTVTTATKKSKAATDAANLRTIAAQVATDVLDNEKVDHADSYVADCKSVEDAYVVVYKVGEEIQAFFCDAAKYFSVDDFATVAENGGTVKPTGKVTGSDLICSKGEAQGAYKPAEAKTEG